MASKQLAVEWLVEQLNIWQTIADEDTNATLDTVRKLIEQAKEMEKEQIIETYNEGALDGLQLGEQYYNHVFKS